MGWLQNQALQYALNHFIIPALAPFTFLVIQWMKRGDSWVNQLPKPAKIALAPIISTVVVTLAAFGNQELACSATNSCTLVDVTPAVLTAALGAGGAWLMHYLKNRPVPPKEPKQ